MARKRIIFIVFKIQCVRNFLKSTLAYSVCSMVYKHQHYWNLLESQTTSKPTESECAF